MATYVELRELMNPVDTELRGRIEVAVIVAAAGIITEPNTKTNYANRSKWAHSAFQNPQGEGRTALMAVIASNAGLTVAEINKVTDEQVQAAVDKVINILAGEG